MDKKLEVIELLTEELQEAQSRLEDKQDEVNALRRKHLYEEGITEHGIKVDRIKGMDAHFNLDTSSVPKVLTKNRKKYFERLKQKLMRGRK